MAENSSNRIDAYNELKRCLDKIKNEKPARNHPSSIETLNPSKDFKMIRCQEENVMEVNKNMVDRGLHKIQAGGSACTTRYDSVEPREKGTNLHTILSNEINHLEAEGAAAAGEPLPLENEATKEEKQWFNLLHDYLKEKFKVSLLRSISKVPLWGYAVAVERNPSRPIPNCYFWSGEANAIGLLKVKEKEYKYVIVDWKLQEKPEFWESSKTLTSLYSQCLPKNLIYARLLKMHMNLDYWPPILLVPFGPNGEYMHPRLFTDYPDQCKKYQWSRIAPSLKFKKGALFKDTLEEGLLRRDMKLKDVFKDDATIDDLHEALRKFCRVSVED